MTLDFLFAATVVGEAGCVASMPRFPRSCVYLLIVNFHRSWSNCDIHRHNEFFTDVHVQKLERSIGRNRFSGAHLVRMEFLTCMSMLIHGWRLATWMVIVVQSESRWRRLNLATVNAAVPAAMCDGVSWPYLTKFLFHLFLVCACFSACTWFVEHPR